MYELYCSKTGRLIAREVNLNLTINAYTAYIRDNGPTEVNLTIDCDTLIIEATANGTLTVACEGTIIATHNCK